MQDPRMMKSRRQKSQRSAMIPQMPEDYMRGLQESSTLPLKSIQKALKKGSKSDLTQLYRQQDRSMPSSTQMESTVAKEYRALRRKYLELEDESGKMGDELRAVEDEIKILEEEKLQLLDQLVVLEGLVDPSELQLNNE